MLIDNITVMSFFAFFTESLMLFSHSTIIAATQIIPLRIISLHHFSCHTKISDILPPSFLFINNSLIVIHSKSITDGFDNPPL